jgi:hypothetical protein
MLAGMIASIIAIIIDRHSLYDHLKYQYLHEIHNEDLQKEKVAENKAGQTGKLLGIPGSD